MMKLTFSTIYEVLVDERGINLVPSGTGSPLWSRSENKHLPCVIFRNMEIDEYADEHEQAAIAAAQSGQAQLDAWCRENLTSVGQRAQESFAATFR
jgi:UDP-N-acetylglucosamine transferase subunit ALG13